MKRLLALLLLAGLIYGGYIYYRQSTTSRLNSSSPTGNQLIITQASDKLGNLASVLGANISTILEDGQEYLSDMTSGASEPIINQLVTKTQETLKDLPKKEAEKIKYEFCKGVVTEYEGK